MKQLQPSRLLFITLSWFSSNVAAVDPQESFSHLNHANYLFNAINGAMRQWSSSINHNGMSAFIATVPADIEFYHGTRTPYRINDTEWLAFEPEHALLFAGQLRRSPPGHGNHGHPPSPPPKPPSHEQTRIAGRSQQPLFDAAEADDQQLLSSEHDTKQVDAKFSDWEHGYLHTYRTKHALRLLYVDGQSAAKSLKGTPDMQDVVILRNDLGPPIGGDFRGPLMDLERAAALCRRTRNEWNDNIDGIIRMEGGFEIILCSFEDHLDLVSINQATAVPSHNKPGVDHWSNMLHYYQAVASRYDDIGGDRIKLDFGNMVSLFSHNGAIFFDDAGRPRAVNETVALKKVRDRIDKIVVAPSIPKHSVNWQAVTDMIVARYAQRIAYMRSEECDSLSKLHTEIDFAFYPFVDFGSRDAKMELDRCTAQFLPQPSQSNNVIRDAIEHISSTICGNLQLARNADNFEEARQSIDSLAEWLDWPIWRKCRGCSSHEVCFLAIWPVGSLEDLEHPRCRSNMSWAPSKDNYWMDEPDHNSAEIAYTQRFGG